LPPRRTYFGAISTVIVMTAVSLTVTGAGNGAQALLPNLKRVVPCGHVREGELTLVVLTAWNGCSGDDHSRQRRIATRKVVDCFLVGGVSPLRQLDQRTQCIQ
jgi:hypothetical protein